MMRSHVGLALAATLIFGMTLSGCSQQTKTTATPGTATLKIAIPNGKLPVSMTISDVAISSATQPVLRVGFKITNGQKNMLLCDPSYFYIQLGDGTTIPADLAAENTCTPDSLDPKASATGRMYFDLTEPYTGKLYLIVEARAGKVVGVTTTVVR
jgi:hypothetical protein